MKKYTLYKSYDLLNEQERNEWVGTYIDSEIVDKGDEENIDYTNLDIKLSQLIDDDFDCQFGERGNWYYSPLKDVKIQVSGTLGLWNGTTTIRPHVFDNLNEALTKCLEDENEIYEDSYGNLHLNAYHHDGCNHFVFKVMTDKGARVLHFTKQVWGC